MPHQQPLFSRLLNPLRATLRRLQGPARRPMREARRARLQVEALEAKVVPSASHVLSPAPVLDAAHTTVSNHLAQYNGTYKISYVLATPFPASNHFTVTIHNGVISGSNNHGTVSKTGAINLHGTIQGFTFTLTGSFKIGGGHVAAHGHFSGSFMGETGSGTWSATKIK